MDRPVAPPGERAGFTGWLRILGFTGSDQIAPPRRWERQNVHLVADEMELSAFRPGPRGSVGGTQTGVAAEFSTFQLIAGGTGARVALFISANGRFRVQNPVTLSATAPGPTIEVIDWSDPNLIGSSSFSRGSLAAEPNVNAATLVSSAPPLVGTPTEIWVPPGRALLAWAFTVAATMHAAFIIREPATAP